jgi:hypothetical protein
MTEAAPRCAIFDSVSAAGATKQILTVALVSLTTDH